MLAMRYRTYNGANGWDKLSIHCSPGRMLVIECLHFLFNRRPSGGKRRCRANFSSKLFPFLQEALRRRNRVSHWPAISPFCKENFLDHISYAFRLEVTVGENVIAWMQRSDNERMEESWAAPASGAGLRALLPLSKVERCWLAPYAGSCSNSML